MAKRHIDPRRVDSLLDAIERKNAELVADNIAGIIDDHIEEDTDPGEFISEVIEELENHAT